MISFKVPVQSLETAILRTYILTSFWVFLFVLGYHMLIGLSNMKTKYHLKFLSGDVVLAVLNMCTQNLNQ